MNRQVACAAGMILLAGLGGWASPASSQGAMTPRPPDVRVAPPPPAAPPPVVAPTPPPMAPAMAPTVAPIPATPAPGTRTTTRGPAGGPPPFTDAQTRALPSVGVGVRGPGGTRQLTSDANGVVSLGPLRQGRYDLTVNQKDLGGGTGNQPAAIGILLPAVQAVREGARRFVSVVVTPVNDAPTLQIRIDVDAKGQVSAVNWGNGIGVNVAAGDVNGDGRADLRVFEDLAQRNPSGETRLAFTGLGSGMPTANEAAIVTSRSNIKRPSIMLPNVGATATGPGGVMQVRSDGEGWTRFGKLPIGNTIVEVNGGDMASALKASVGPNTPIPQKTLIELLVVIAIIAIKTDGTPIVFTGSVPASAVKTVKANLRVGRDGNLMDVDWGNGPQLPQVLPRTGPAMLTVQGAKGTYTLEPVLVSSLQANAGKSAPGMVDVNTATSDISFTR